MNKLIKHILLIVITITIIVGGDTYKKIEQKDNLKKMHNQIELLKKECENGVGISCTNLGLLYAKGSFNGVKDYSSAKIFYKKACDLGNMAGCANLGLLYELGRGVKKDLQEAKRLYVYACNKGDWFACLNLENFGIGEDNYIDKELNKKWITPSKNICNKYGGIVLKNACFINYYQSKKICKYLNGRLPSIEELGRVVILCGGHINENKNEYNSKYQSCYQEMGFKYQTKINFKKIGIESFSFAIFGLKSPTPYEYNIGQILIKDFRNFYWSTTDYPIGDNFKSILIFENGNIFHNMKSRRSFVRCIIDR